MRLRLVRHATLVLEYHDRKLIADPMLDSAGARPAIQNSPNPRNNPLVPLPEPAEEVVRGVEAILVTHMHSDHWDATAARSLRHDLPLFGQPEDQGRFRAEEFIHAQPVNGSIGWNGIQITRTGGQHGTGEIGRAMAPVSGFVLRAAAEPVLYIAGDTIWCEEVHSAIETYRPEIVVVNAGAARFLEGDPITMTATDLIAVCQAAPRARIVAVHMEAINHCLLTRSDLAFQVEAARLNNQVVIPDDGGWIAD